VGGHLEDAFFAHRNDLLDGLTMQGDAQPPLSERQAEIAGMVVSGKSSREIAAALSLSPRTVQTHIAAIFNKLGVRSRVELTATLLRSRHAAGGGLEEKHGKAETSRISSVGQGELPPNNLPFTITKLVGRDAMLADLIELVRDQRLVTLVGPGGVGKTRAALGAGARLLPGFSDGVFIVDMSVLADASLVPRAVAGVLGVSGSPERPVEEALAAWLRPRSALLIFDSCERFVGAAAALGERLLRACPQVRILATSQETLEAAGEHVYEVTPLECPEPERAGVEDSIRYSAVELFVDRARATARRFTLSDDNVRTVSEICRRVDGIPLGIELAASGVRVLGLETLARLLERRLPILDGKRGLPERHQTMRALFEWSDGLLDDEERTVLRRLAIFAGGWTVEAAEAVCADGSLERRKVFGLLSRLVRKSQVATEHGVAGTRYRLLDSMRQFALEALQQRGERAATERRHAQWAAAFAEDAAELAWTAPRAKWLARAAPEVNNMRGALTWAFGPAGEPVLGMRIAAASGTYWHDRGLLVEGREWITKAFEHARDSTDDDLKGRLWAAFSSMLAGSRRVEAAKRAIELFEYTGNRRRLASSLHSLASGYYQLAQFSETESAADRALSLFREIGMTRSVFYASTLGFRALALSGLKRYDEARKAFDEDIALLEALGDSDRATVEKLNYAELECALGDLPRAIGLVESVFDALRASAQRADRVDDFFLAAAAVNATAYQLVLGQIERAQTMLGEALTRARSVQYPAFTSVAIQHAATIAALRSDVEVAARLRGYVDEVYRNQGIQREPTEQRLYEMLTAPLEERPSGEELRRLTAEGALLSEDEAVELASSARLST
jgi:predicted ATPase/DNA-binding CsgD family transcriptional regulator